MRSLTIAGMTVPPEELELAAAFPAADRDRWRELCKGVLRKSGAATEDTPLETIEELLSTTTYDGITVAPLYTAEDAVPGRPGLPPYARGVLPGAEVVAGWDVRQRHAHPDPGVTRAAIQADLENGVTSVWLTLGQGGLPVTGLPEALGEVYLDLAPVILDAGAETQAAAEAFLALAAGRGVEPARLTGGLGADPLGLAARTGVPAELEPAAGLAVRCVREYPGLRAITVDATVYHDAGGSDAEELGCSIAAGVAYLRALTDAGLGVDEALGTLEFRYAATADQFLTIAKLRAARRLWARVAQACGASLGEGGQHQHAVTSSAMMTARDPWVNMLRTTIAAFAAGVGGADAVTVQPFDAPLGLPDDFARRIARNTQALLLEEASLSRVADPAGGSWYIERLTEELAQASWAWFQEIERAGGAAGALRDGLVEDRLAATWAGRRDNLAHRRDPLTGVSEFPNPTENLPVRTPAPPSPGGGLPRIRYAQDYEALRDAADAHAERTGRRPAVFLATLGPAAAYTARGTFAANLFQAGGLRTEPSGPGTDPADLVSAFRESGAGVVCLCSSDKVYADHAGPVAQALRAAGAKRIWLAGKGDYPGVDARLFAGCDALEVLRTTLDDLGVAR
ncbi:MAG: methylmalonyl-CoA mutase [Streptosporangiaceae bacterium]|jgi:methylmalonyl-CoA mutase|nr:methylmalonyl-CoA mutase [Streptosporangiaceae bacterium]